MSIKNGDMPAIPVFVDGGGQFEPVTYTGLTKREELAARFMAAWIIHHGTAGGYGYSSEHAALGAIQDADALLAELERAK